MYQDSLIYIIYNSVQFQKKIQKKMSHTNGQTEREASPLSFFSSFAIWLGTLKNVFQAARMP